MQIRLVFCSRHLKEVEDKLTQLHATMSDDPEERVRVVKAVTLIRQARRAVSEVQEMIEELRANHKRRVMAQSA
jgi:hypothetical protein